MAQTETEKKKTGMESHFEPKRNVHTQCDHTASESQDKIIL
jgi:hypothetical protein